ncbi:hypothetical protein GDO81_005622 [Engystomops pustulosus]|uniref:Uncharacterized protein n=1 Tax=Engystomops pustulosus TaxID=76066 RepID=A0AAV7CQ92_ENGPU|nr:hypothetical protein GDO81_005622 [Engystomops pustulosus]
MLLLPLWPLLPQKESRLLRAADILSTTGNKNTNANYVLTKYLLMYSTEPYLKSTLATIQVTQLLYLTQ